MQNNLSQFSQPFWKISGQRQRSQSLPGKFVRILLYHINPLCIDHVNDTDFHMWALKMGMTTRKTVTEN